jgi:hypothetical protein
VLSPQAANTKLNAKSSARAVEINRFECILSSS